MVQLVIRSTSASIGTHIAGRCFTSLSLFLDVLSKLFLTVFLLKTFATFHFSLSLIIPYYFRGLNSVSGEIQDVAM